MKNTCIISFITIIISLALIISGCGNKVKDEEKSVTKQVVDQNSSLEKKEDINQSSNLEFLSKTVMGKNIDNNVFKDYKLTMINFWAIYCKYCIKEMPDIQKVYDDENKNGVNVLGVLTDIEGNEDTEHILLAKKILEKSGVKYENIIGEKSIGKYFAKLSSGVPFTIFVDNTGKMVGKEISGVKSKEEFKKEIDERLKSLK